MEDSVNVKFGKRVIFLRKQRGITQEELSFRCGIHRAYMGTIERGEKSATLDTVEKVAHGLGAGIKELFDFLASCNRILIE